MEQINDLVSIVIITRNRCEIIARSIESILNQSYNYFELIIVDGASTDNTKEVVNSFNDNRLRYYKQKRNISATDSKRYGITKCNGKYISFHDDDDEWCSSKLEKQIIFMKILPNNYGAVYCWEDFIDDKSKKYLYTNKPNLYGDVYLDILKKPGGIGGGGLLLYKKEAVDFYMNKSFSSDTGSDYQMNLVIAQKYKFHFLPEVLHITHINHKYDRMSDKTSSIFSLERKISLYKNILRQNNDAFSKNRKLEIYHIKALITLLSESKNNEMFKYIQELIKIEPLNLNNYKKIAKSILTYLRNNK